MNFIVLNVENNQIVIPMRLKRHQFYFKKNLTVVLAKNLIYPPFHQTMG